MSELKIYEPNYTQVPNAVISLMPSLSGAELKVILAIVRQTAGWQKSRDRISYSRLMEMTGMGREAVSKAVQSDKLKGVIRVIKTDKGNEYELIIHEAPGSKIEPDSGSKIEPVAEEVVRKSNRGGSKIEPVAGSKIELTKEIYKETNKTKRAGARASERDLASREGGGERLTASEIYRIARSIDTIPPEDLPGLLDNLFSRARDQATALQIWVGYLKSTGKPVNNFVLSQLLTEHQSTPLARLKQMIRYSMSRGYKSLVAPEAASPTQEAPVRASWKEFSAEEYLARSN